MFEAKDLIFHNCVAGFSFLAFLILILVVVVVFYIHYQHRRYQHLPGPNRDSFFTGNIPCIKQRTMIQGGSFHELWLEWHLEFGQIFVIWIFWTAVVMVTDPESAKKVLVTLNLPKAPRIYNKIAYCFGTRLAGNGILTEVNHEVWKKKRSLLNKAFHRSYLMNLMNSFNSICEVFLKKMGKLADGKTPVVMSNEFGRVTLDVIGKIGFDIDINAIEDAESSFPTAVRNVLEGVQSQFRDPFWMIRFWAFPYQNKIVKFIQYFRKYFQKVIDDRMAQKNNEHRDILAYLVTMSKENDNYKMENMLDDFGTFFVAGQETTSNQLAFTLYEILYHPEIERRIVEEIEQVLGSRHFVEYEDLGKLEYLGMTLKEGLRKHPPIGATQRMLLHKENIGGYDIPAMTAINVPFFVTHRSPCYWENPDHFDPMRFSMENKISHSSTQFMPFSAGPRTCIGKTLSEFEAKVIMARLLQEFKLELVPGQTLAIQEQITLRPKDGVKCIITRRQKSSSAPKPK